MRILRILLVCAAYLLVVMACDDHATNDSEPTSQIDAEGTPDASPGDTAVVDSVPLSDLVMADDSSPPPDLSPEGFCEGVPKARVGDEVAVGVQATSSWIVMDCCDGFTLRMHTSRTPLEALRDDVVFMHRMLGGPLPSPGTWQLDDLPSGLGVDVCIGEAPCLFSGDAPASGWLSVTGESAEIPGSATLCVENLVTDAGEQLSFYTGPVPIAPWGWSEKVAMHLLEDDTLTAVDAAELPLHTLALQPTPLLSLHNFDYYDAETATFHLGYWGFSLDQRLDEPGVFGTPFVVTVDQTPIYLGAILTPISSWGPPMPTVFVDESVGIVRIHAPMGDLPDPRFDPRILDALRAAGRLVE